MAGAQTCRSDGTYAECECSPVASGRDRQVSAASRGAGGVASATAPTPGTTSDAGAPADAAPATNLGAIQGHPGGAHDAGHDAGSSSDAGRAPDAGRVGDAGHPTDAGNSADAGRSHDAGHDAGMSLDAGQGVDGGTVTVDAGHKDAGGCPTGSLSGIGPAVAIPGPSNGLQGCAVALPGTIQSVVYRPNHDLVYTLDAANRTLSIVDLNDGGALSREVVLTPSAACIDETRNRLWVVNIGTSFLSEHDLTDLSLVRTVAWPAPTYGSSPSVHMQIYCGKKRLYVVDGAWAPGLWTFENLDTCATPVSHTSQVSSVGAMALASDESEFYYWYQYGWSAGYAGTDVTRVSTADWSVLDTTMSGYTQGFYRDPLDTPMLWDHKLGYVFAKNRILSAANLSQLVFTLSDPADGTSIQAVNNIYAIDEARGRFATRTNVYDTATVRSITQTVDSTALQYFFDRNGALRSLSSSGATLECQPIP